MSFADGRRSRARRSLPRAADRNVEARDVDNDVGAYVVRSRRAYVNIVEGELITRDVQH